MSRSRTRRCTIRTPWGAAVRDLTVVPTDAPIAMCGRDRRPGSEVFHHDGNFYLRPFGNELRVADVISFENRLENLEGRAKAGLWDRLAVQGTSVLVRVPEPVWLLKVVDSAGRLSIRRNSRLNVDIEDSTVGYKALNYDGGALNPGSDGACAFAISDRDRATAMKDMVTEIVPYAAHHHYVKPEPLILRPDLFRGDSLVASVDLMAPTLVALGHRTMSLLSRGGVEKWVALRTAVEGGRSRADCFAICAGAGSLVGELRRICDAEMDIPTLAVVKRALIGAVLLSRRARFEPDGPAPMADREAEIPALAP